MFKIKESVEAEKLVNSFKNLFSNLLLKLSCCCYLLYDYDIIVIVNYCHKLFTLAG